METVYKVELKEPSGQHSWITEVYFSSIAAIYDVFTPEQIGCKKENLWNKGKKNLGIIYINNKCTITKHLVVSKTQNKNGK